MKKRLFLIASVLFFFECTFGQSDTLQLNEITVRSSPYGQVFGQNNRPVQLIGDSTLANLPATGITMILEQLSGIDFRQRGLFGIQADINIRGGSFDQALLLVNGIPVNDPQSGHLNLDIAVPTDQIQQIEIIDGPASRWFGTNALSGGINIITKQNHRQNLQFSLGAGQYGYMQSTLTANYKTGRIWQNTSLQFSRSDGYERDTDFKDKTISHQAHYRNKYTRIDWQFSYRDKAFGAHNFYTGKYPDQFEQTRTFFNSLHLETGKKIRTQTNIAWRRHYDRFELFRQGPGWYQWQNGWYVMQGDSAGFRTPSGFFPYTGPNFHRTDVASLGTGIRFHSKWGKSALGINYRYEKIISNVLGEIQTDTLFSKIESQGYYNHKKSRSIFNLFINHLYNHRNFSLSLGLHTFYNPENGFSINPGADFSYFLHSKWKVFVSANRSNRLPTFTDLYYQGPTHISNPDLKPETAFETETGIKYLSHSIGLTTSIFYRTTHHLIDWVRLSPQDKWESKNLTILYTQGLSLKFFFLNSNHPNSPLKSIRFNYTYLKNSKTSENFLSLYALDYLKHQMGLSLEQRILKHFEAGWSFLFQQRKGSFFDAEVNRERPYPSVFLINARLSYQLASFQFYLQGINLLNQKYHDIGSVLMPGRWITAGLKWTLNFEKTQSPKN